MTNVTDPRYLDEIAADIRKALDEAEYRLNTLREQRLIINAEIKQIHADVHRLTKLNKAVTPKDQNGPDE